MRGKEAAGGWRFRSWFEADEVRVRVRVRVMVRGRVRVRAPRRAWRGAFAFLHPPSSP